MFDHCFVYTSRSLQFFYYLSTQNISIYQVDILVHRVLHGGTNSFAHNYHTRAQAVSFN